MVYTAATMIELDMTDRQESPVLITERDDPGWYEASMLGGSRAGNADAGKLKESACSRLKLAAMGGRVARLAPITANIMNRSDSVTVTLRVLESRLPDTTTADGEWNRATFNNTVSMSLLCSVYLIFFVIAGGVIRTLANRTRSPSQTRSHPFLNIPIEVSPPG